MTLTLREYLLLEALRAEYHDGQPCDCYPPRPTDPLRTCEEYALGRLHETDGDAA